MAEVEENGEEPPEEESRNCLLIIGLVLAIAGGGGGFYAVQSGMLFGTDSHAEVTEKHEDPEMAVQKWLMLPSFRLIRWSYLLGKA